MGLFVKTNVSSLRGYNYLTRVTKELDTTYERLSSGLRINSAKDDAAGLQVSDRLTSQINGLYQGNRNTNDAIALAQTIEGGLDEMTNLLQRIRTLAVQAGNGVNTAEDRSALDQEAKSLTDEISRIATQTTYNGKTILNGCDLETIHLPTTPIEHETIYENTLSKLGGQGILTVQVGANSGDTIQLKVNAFKFSFIVSRSVSNADNVLKQSGFEKITSGVNSYWKFNLATADSASNAISSIDKMLEDVDAQRANLGSIQNRLESSIRVQSNVATNESDARSRIRDTDFAEESAKLSQQSIIQQAATSMLLQANARPQIGLNLLG